MHRDKNKHQSAYSKPRPKATMGDDRHLGCMEKVFVVVIVSPVQNTTELARKNSSHLIFLAFSCSLFIYIHMDARISIGKYSKA